MMKTQQVMCKASKSVKFWVIEQWQNQIGFIYMVYVAIRANIVLITKR